jgi:hypothetical protein
LLAGCAIEEAEPIEHSDTGDAQLAAFGREHPKCQLWSNWQKMCSRTGPGGKPYCVSDPKVIVSPSAPFCGYQGLGVPTADLDSPGGASRGRFCQEKSTYDWSTDTESGRGVPYCRTFNPDRPFNGRNLAARRHPWCKEWSDTYTERPVCAEDGSGRNRPSCGALAAGGYQHERPLYCSRLEPPDWCAKAEGLLDRVEAPPNAIVVGHRNYQESNFYAVHGMVCRRRIERRTPYEVSPGVARPENSGDAPR